MARKYFGKYVKEVKEKGWLKSKSKLVCGNVLVTADSFAEAQEKLVESLGEFDIKVCLLTPYWEELE